ncbi:MAG: hypothetical protein JNJ46_09795 [Myxococcales bacterium]|nr:hypothetical protein [Myxococcales bacterium]
MRSLSCAALGLSRLVFSGAMRCGGGSGTADERVTPNASSCDYRPLAPKGPNSCEEYVGDATATQNYKNSCALNPGAVWATVGYPRVNALGGCTSVGPTFTLTNWGYQGGPYTDAAG